MKKFLLWVFFIPAGVRSMWKIQQGRQYVLRDESNGFLRYAQWCYENEPGERTDLVLSFYTQLFEEIELRKRRGTWVEERSC